MVDKSIKDTEQLLESFLPNMAKIWEIKRQQQTVYTKKREEEVKLSQKWQSIKDKATTRGDKECPICYNAYANGKEVQMLSCSHMYHRWCLESFENFDIAANLCCPMCRHPNYEKTTINVV